MGDDSGDAPLRFDLHIGIDYSGAKTATARLAHLQVFVATTGEPRQVVTPSALQGRRRNWSRQEVAEWLIGQARSGQRFVAGIDHAFSLPLAYMRRHGLPEDQRGECWPRRTARCRA